MQAGQATSFRVLSVLAVSVMWFTSACSAVETSTTSVAPTSIEIRSFAFEPHVLDASAGATVSWTNNDGIDHTATSGTPSRQGVPGATNDRPSVPDGLFDLPLNGAGSTASYVFMEPGTYTYFCAIHAGMSGVIRVS